MKKKKKIFVWQINERKYSATGLCSTISYLISVAKNILICQKYQVFFNQIWRVSHWVEHRNLVSVSGWQLRLLKHCWSRDINSNISLALCLQPRRYRRGLTDSMKASPPAGLQQVHLPLQTLLEVKARQRECSRRVPGCPSCGGWNWTPTDHLTRQLPGLKDCLGLQTAGDGAQATPAGMGLQEDYVDMGNDR